MLARAHRSGAPIQLLVFGGCALLLLGRQNQHHRPHALKIVTPLDGPAEMWFPGHQQMVGFHEPLLIAPNVEHVVASPTRRLTLFVDPETRGRPLSSHLDCRLTAPLPAGLLPVVMAGARRLRGDLGFDPEAESQARAYVDSILVPGAWPTAQALDSRVLQAAALIIRDHLHRHDPARASAATQLSSRWLARLFRAQTGISTRRYSQWVKLAISVQHACSNHSLTDAAHAGGFADMSHFTRTMQTRLGMMPSLAPFANARVVEDFFSPLLSAVGADGDRGSPAPVQAGPRVETTRGGPR